MKKEMVITDHEQAMIKDCFTIMRLMYEDMVKNDLRTPSRIMAGNMLHSLDYANTEMKIDSNYDYRVIPFNGKKNNSS